MPKPNAKNIKLTNAVPFISEKGLHLHLTYEYEDEKGRHAYILPKISTPFREYELPDICVCCDPRDYEAPYITGAPEIYLQESLCELAIAKGVKKPAYIFDIVIDPIVRELTLDEIEYELGCKVKLVKEHTNNNAEN